MGSLISEFANRCRAAGLAIKMGAGKFAGIMIGQL
jgi:hypothetical protein